MTDSQAKLNNLKLFVEDALKQAQHLERSYSKCSSIELNGSIDNLNHDQLDSLEALVSRFGRLSDILVQKIFRSIDDLELVRSGTVIDVINLAEKREIIDSAHDFREIRQTRNEIEHEYVTSGLADLYQKTLNYTPVLLSASKKLKEYVDKMEI